jgi:hypothetical protein
MRKLGDSLFAFSRIEFVLSVNSERHNLSKPGQADRETEGEKNGA